MLTLSRAKGLNIGLPLGLVENEILRVLAEERLVQFSMLKYLLSSSDLTMEAKKRESTQNFDLMFPWVNIEKREKDKLERAKLLAMRDELSSE